MVASRRAARSTRSTCRRSRAARSQHVSRRSAAASTRIVERRGPSRREGSAWTVDGTRARPRHRRRRTQDSCGAGRRDRRAIIFAIRRKQQQRLPRSKVNRWLRLAAPCFLALGDDGLIYGGVSHKSIRWPGCTEPVENTRSGAVFGPRRLTIDREARVADECSGLRSLCQHQYSK